MISAGDFRNVVTIEYDNNVYQIIEFQHVKPGKGAAFVRTKIKNVMSGGVVENADFGADVVLTVLLPSEDVPAFQAAATELSAGTVEVLEAGERFQDVPFRLPKG